MARTLVVVAFLALGAGCRDVERPPPGPPTSRPNVARANDSSDLATARDGRGELSTSRRRYLEAIARASDPRDGARAYLALGRVEAARGDCAAAGKAFERASGLTRVAERRGGAADPSMIAIRHDALARLRHLYQDDGGAAPCSWTGDETLIVSNSP